MRRTALIALLAAGCGGDPAPAVRLDAIPAAALERCRGLGPRRDVPVLCPPRLPPGRWTLRYQTLRTGRAEYLANFETDPPGRGDAFHALAGGRRGRFRLRPFEPRRRDLGLGDARVVRGTRVAGRPAVLLRAAPYPGGGVHGGHLAVVWNQGGHGYALSLHFARRERPATLLAAAEAMSRVALARDAAGEAR